MAERTRRTTLAATALGLVLALVGGACSSSGSSSEATTTTTAPGATTTLAPTTTVAAEPPGSLAQAEDRFQQGLLTAADLGPGFVDGPTPGPPDPAEPSPCGTPSPAAVAPPLFSVASLISNQAGTLLVQERINLYDTSAELQRAVVAGVDGLACGTGTTGASGEPFTVTGQADLSEQLRVPSAVWDVTTPGGVLSLVVMELASSLVTLEVQASDLEAATSVDPVAVAQAAMAKLADL